jgi:hypothetical protein
MLDSFFRHSVFKLFDHELSFQVGSTALYAAVQSNQDNMIKELISYHVRNVKVDAQQVTNICCAIRFSSSDALQDWLVCYTI